MTKPQGIPRLCRIGELCAEVARLEGLILDAAEDQHAMNTGINSIGDLVDEARRIRGEKLTGFHEGSPATGGGSWVVR